MQTVYDVIVVGCGGFGSAAMSHLSRRGLKVLGIDRFTPPHDLGSSHGDTRIIRKAYFEHPNYVPLLQRAYKLWDELSERSAAAFPEDTAKNGPLFIRTGLFAAGTMTGEMIPGVLESAQTHGLPVENLSSDDLRRRFPMFSVPEGYTALFEKDAGYLRVERCIDAHLHDSLSMGGQLLTNTVVTGISHTTSSVTVRTADQTYSAGAVVVTGGAWTGQLMPEYQKLIEVRRKILFWYPTDGSLWKDHGISPVYMMELPGNRETFYGFPPLDGRTLKMAEHTGGDLVTDPLLVNRTVQSHEGDDVAAFAKMFLPGTSSVAERTAVCMYSMTADGNFLIDRLPSGPVVVAAGFSGHGFKFTSAIGEVTADLVVNGKTPHPVEFLSARRFLQQ
ncbi:MAG: N-methyl-L-tryptophan oxidase [Planctomyces sp.]